VVGAHAHPTRHMRMSTTSLYLGLFLLGNGCHLLCGNALARKVNHAVHSRESGRPAHDLQKSDGKVFARVSVCVCARARARACTCLRHIHSLTRSPPTNTCK